jgi:hypothetical protein
MTANPAPAAAYHARSLTRVPAVGHVRPAAIRRPASRRLVAYPSHDRRIPVTTPASLRGWIADNHDQAIVSVSPPGVIGGAVLTAARRSAEMNRLELAGHADLSIDMVAHLEGGLWPLFCVRHDRLCELAGALDRAGAQVGNQASELMLASQCDLLLTSMLRGFEDYAEVPPIEQDVAGRAARGLLRWALAGVVPLRYRAYMPPWRLLAEPDVTILAAIARDLLAGARGSELVRFGGELQSLVTA